MMTKKDFAERLKKNLNHKNADRRELTILLLVFVLEENQIIQEYLIENNFVNEFISFMNPVDKNGNKTKKGTN